MSVFTGWWAERAQRAEQDADRMAALLEELVRQTNILPERAYWQARDCVRDYKSNRDRRYAALPAGHTLEGNLTSGGVL